jgi:hypothetical protein
VFVSKGQSPAAILLLSLTVFAAAAVGIGALRTLAPLADDVEEMRPFARVLGGRTRAALEREKALTLRSIKELEFDHAMGKLSEADFAEMGARLRGKAAGLIRRLDDGTSYRVQIEQELERRVGPPVARAIVTPGLCSACGTANGGDARFCKQCGASVA